MPDYWPRDKKAESFAYIGRDRHTTLHVALSILVVGLFIGAVAGPTEQGHAERAAIDASRRIAEADTTTIESPPALVQPTKMITASVSGDDTLIGAATPADRRQSLKVRRGDTLMSLMLSAGIARDDAHDAVTALRKVYDPKDLRAGQHVRLTLSPKDDLQEVSLDPTAAKRVAVRRQDDTSFRAFELHKELTRKVRHAAGRIDSSLYTAAMKQNVPLPVLEQLIHIYSWGVDFQREIQPGDRFEVDYERYVDEDGDFVRNGNVIYAKLILSGEAKPLYRFEVEPGVVDYFDANGRSAQRALLRTPIDGARISSPFGLRKDPIRGYTKMHRGVDFAAPRGTPIFAAGNGVIVRRGRNGGYGNYIQIRHSGRYATAYGHMSRFASSLHIGSHVHQGEIIGYVGSTGRSTGPHLHYEILKSGDQVNPLKVKMPSGHKLAGTELARFEADRKKVDRMTASLSKGATVTAER